MTMTAQAIFNRAVRGVIRQGGPSLDKEAENCAYRGANGRRCAAGWLIPNKKYRVACEGASADDMIEMFRLDHLKPHADLIADIQNAHDGCAFSDEFLADFASRCRAIAEDYRLTLPAEIRP